MTSIFTRPDLALIDAATAAQLDAQLAKRATPARPRHIVHPLAGWARCGACGGSIAADSHGFYMCDRRRRVGDCDVRLRARVQLVEGAIVEGLHAQVLSDDVLDIVRAGIQGAAEAARFTTWVDPGEIEAQLAKLRARK